MQAFTKTVSLSLSPNFSGGPALSMLPNAVTPSGNAAVQMTTTAQTAGLFPFTVTATSGATNPDIQEITTGINATFCAIDAGGM